MNLHEALKILELPNKTNLREAKVSYRRLAKMHHPDVNSKEGALKFIEVVAAYEFLKDYVERNKSSKSSEYKTSKQRTRTEYTYSSQQESSTVLVVTEESPWNSRKSIYEMEFNDFVIGLNQAMEESFRIFEHEGQRLCENVLQAIISTIQNYTETSEIRNKFHRDVNKILQGERLTFLNKLFKGPRNVIAKYDYWLTKMRLLALRHSLPQTIGEYFYSMSGFILTCCLLTIFIPASVIAAAFLPLPQILSFLTGISFIGLSLLLSLWIGKDVYCRFSINRVQKSTTSFSPQAGLQVIDEELIPISKEQTRQEKSEQGAFTGGMIGLFALGPIAGIIGVALGSILGGLSGKEFVEMKQEVAQRTIEEVGSVLDEFFKKTEDRLINEHSNLINRMQQNFINNLQDEKLIYNL